MRRRGFAILSREHRGFLFLAVTLVGIGFYMSNGFGLPGASVGGCGIKGNVSRSGELIYHVPGGAYYDRTIVSSFKGERWFCSEAEARAAGWRRSMR